LLIFGKFYFMDEKKQEDNTGVATDAAPETITGAAEVVTDAAVDPVTEVAASEAVAEPMPTSEETPVAEVTTVAPTAFNYKMYVGAVLGIIVICGGLLFVLEKEGRISTGLFAGVIAKIDASTPAAKVNGTVISKTEFESSLEQLNEMSASQGADLADATVVSELRTQAIDTLVNAELLRQAALAAGMTATSEQIEGRLTEIRDGLGGEEALAARMAEFGVTEESLRRDIENEFLIQALFDAKVNTDNIEVTDAEITELYNQAGGTEGGLPPLAEVREQIVAQIRFNKEQVLVTEYIDTLRSEAEIEVLI
jgi:hypothetical protein